MDVAVVGAGWSGCAAAVTLARLGHRVTIYEAGAVAGGRARRVVRAGLPIDNGQHLLLGAYVHTRNVLAVVHGGDGETGLVRAPLAIQPLARTHGSLQLRARHLPAPLGLLLALMGAKGLAARDRMAVIAWFRRLQRRQFRCPRDMTVAQLVADGPPVAARLLWMPLCVAALNTPAERASAQVFANVLCAAFAGGRGASDFLFAATDLSALFPEAALAYVASSGGRALLRTRARVAALHDDSVWIEVQDEPLRFDAAVVAVGPHQLETALADGAPFAEALQAARGLAYEPIATVWLGYAERTPLADAIARLDDSPGQWIVDRPDVLARAGADATRPPLAQIVAVVISASDAYEASTPAQLAAACDAQLRRLVPAWPRLAWSQTIVERRATYACTPGRPLPANSQPHPRVALAGDWIDAELPATLEAAVRTGVKAAVVLDQRLAATD